MAIQQELKISRRSHGSLSLNSSIHFRVFLFFQIEYFLLIRFKALFSFPSSSICFPSSSKEDLWMNMDEHRFSPCLLTSHIHTHHSISIQSENPYMIPAQPHQCSNGYSVSLQTPLRTCQSTQLVTGQKRLHVSPRQAVLFVCLFVFF